MYHCYLLLLLLYSTSSYQDSRSAATTSDVARDSLTRYLGCADDDDSCTERVDCRRPRRFSLRAFFLRASFLPISGKSAFDDASEEEPLGPLLLPRDSLPFLKRPFWTPSFGVFSVAAVVAESVHSPETEANSAATSARSKSSASFDLGRSSRESDSSLELGRGPFSPPSLDDGASVWRIVALW